LMPLARITPGPASPFTGSGATRQACSRFYWGAIPDNRKPRFQTAWSVHLPREHHYVKRPLCAPGLKAPEARAGRAFRSLSFQAARKTAAATGSEPHGLQIFSLEHSRHRDADVAARDRRGGDEAITAWLPRRNANFRSARAGLSPSFGDLVDACVQEERRGHFFLYVVSH
jgi:hypothetical protein